ncbi:branched-chain amino acid transport system II carrier protein [Eubacterium barkeri]|uniref:Branched-chain amino acid transport system carrier protein n=1 Tax=Eubacterium barkeri TaxID=1528 RepID=A0A1H3GJE1_EUBBA|nr:branched-chain amino acid transport system II carrier protein [Eubacterium barkeri]SDY03207.1 branched-chain amino acid:cation transporter, LIVCS family [Eubacterium barkeri]
MNQIKERWIVGLALFSMFFGAGNVIFPPFLGMQAGYLWLPAFISYYLADIGLALLAIFAMLKCNSDIEGITKRIGKIPAALLSCAIFLCVGPLLAIPRTGATTFEMAALPLVPGMNSILFSVLFFALILGLCLKESSVVDIVGKFLTPALFIGLLIVIAKGVINPLGGVDALPRMANVISTGIISGYQTMDVLAALIFGVIIFKTVEQKGYTKLEEKRRIIGGAGLVAAGGLLIVYGGLSYLGATVSQTAAPDISRANLVVDIIKSLMGYAGVVIFAIVVALACVTTAVALVSSSATFFSRMTGGRVKYRAIVIGMCIFSAVVSNVGLETIIAVSEPIFSIVYAPALTLIVLSLFGDRIKSDDVFKAAALGATVVSLITLANGKGLGFDFIRAFPLNEMGLAWVLPTIVCGIIGYFIGKKVRV